ncbi:MAG: MerC family mercury resistance protein [Verrucomicrobiia bacterium]
MKIGIIHKLKLDVIGFIGTLISLFVIAPICCLPLIAAVGASLGLGLFAPMKGVFVYIFKASLVLAVIGAIIGFASHKRVIPAAITILSAAGIFYGLEMDLSQTIIGIGLIGLIIGALWNRMAGKNSCNCGCSPQSSSSTKLESTITCPHCGFQQQEIMPTDRCVYFYQCKNCKTILKPKPSDCCVFCSYGTVKCPPKQVAG